MNDPRIERSVVLFDQLTRMHELDVHDATGAQWLPVYGYDNQVAAYAPARDAIAIVHNEFCELSASLKAEAK